MNCPKCKAELPNNAKFCAACGTTFTAATQVPPFRTPAKKASLAKFIVIGVVGLAVLAIIAIAYLLFGAGGGSATLDDYCNKIELLEKAPILGPVYKEKLVAEEQNNGAKQWELLSSASQKDMAMIYSRLNWDTEKTRLETCIQNSQQGLKTLKGDDLKKAQARVDFWQKKLKALDELENNGARNYWIWTWTNPEETNDKKVWQEEPKYVVVTEEIKGDHGKIIVKYTGEKTPRPLAFFVKEDGKWRLGGGESERGTKPIP